MSAERIPRLRLAQIAEKRLIGLGVQTRIDHDAEEARGLFVFRTGAVVDPSTRVRVAEAPFRSVGHDQLEFTQPPLAGLGPVSFYDAATTQVVEERVARALGERMQSLQEATRRLHALRIEPQFDLARLYMVTIIETPTRLYELVADGKQFRIARLKEGKGDFVELAPGLGALRLEDFTTRSDIELHLSSLGAKLLPASPRASSEATTSALESLTPAEGSLTLELLQRFGPGAIIRGEPRIVVSRDFRFNGLHYRFEATHESGSSFRGRFGGASGDKWADRFDLTRFPGIEALVRIVLGLPETSLPPPPPDPASRASQAASAAPAPTAGGLGMPVAGETWVMSVIVEQESAAEIRYVCTNIDGQPYGAPRVLPRDDFPRVFTPFGNGWRLRVIVDGADGAGVMYRQLDAGGQPRGASKRIPLAIFTTTFIPEAAAY